VPKSSSKSYGEQQSEEGVHQCLKVQAAVWDIQGGHLLSSHHSPCVKLLGVLYVSRHPKNLYKLYQLYGKPPSICQPPEDPLLLIKVESGLELSYDLLVPIVLKLHDVSGAMEITSLKNPIEGGILLLPHVVKVDPLHRDNWLGLLQKHGGIPTLMEKV
jgi:hypothetical protein